MDGPPSPSGVSLHCEASISAEAEGRLVSVSDTLDGGHMVLVHIPTTGVHAVVLPEGDDVPHNPRGGIVHMESILRLWWSE